MIRKIFYTSPVSGDVYQVKDNGVLDVFSFYKKTAIKIPSAFMEAFNYYNYKYEWNTLAIHDIYDLISCTKYDIRKIYKLYNQCLGKNYVLNTNKKKIYVNRRDFLLPIDEELYGPDTTASLNILNEYKGEKLDCFWADWLRDLEVAKPVFPVFCNNKDGFMVGERVICNGKFDQNDAVYRTGKVIRYSDYNNNLVGIMFDADICGHDLGGALKRYDLQTRGYWVESECLEKILG